MRGVRSLLAVVLFVLPGCSSAEKKKGEDPPADHAAKKKVDEERPATDPKRDVIREEVVRFSKDEPKEGAIKGEEFPGGGVRDASGGRRDPTTDDALHLLKQRVALNPTDDGAHFRLALLHLAGGELVEAEHQLSLVRDRSEKIYPFIEAYLYQQLGDHKHAGEKLRELMENWCRTDGFKIERAELCKKVQGYRRYELHPDGHIAPGGTALLYVEPRNFTLKREGERAMLHLTYDWRLFDDRNQEVPVPWWQNCNPSDRYDDPIYQGGVTEFHQSFRLRLPENLAMGSYRIKVIVTDFFSGKFDQIYVPLYVTAK